MNLDQNINIKVNSETMKTLMEKCSKLVELQNQIEKCEENLKVIKSEARDLSDFEIPDLMTQCNLTMLKTDDDVQIQVRPVVSAHLPSDKTDEGRALRQECFNWMRQNGYGDLIKNHVTVEFAKGQDTQAKQLMQDLIEKQKLNAHQKEWVEPSTLKKEVRVALHENTGQPEFPQEMFKVYAVNQATIKKLK